MLSHPKKQCSSVNNLIECVVLSPQFLNITVGTLQLKNNITNIYPVRRETPKSVDKDFEVTGLVMPGSGLKSIHNTEKKEIATLTRV